MPTKPKPRLTAYSFSRWSTYEGCPSRAMYAFIEKLPQPQSAAMKRGGDIHEDAEMYVRSARAPKLKEPLSNFTEEFKALRKRRAYVETEGQWAFTRDWRETEWFSDDAFCRIKMDAFDTGEGSALVTPRGIDYKTGKRRPIHKEQLGLYALGALLKFPHIESITVENWYLDLGELDDESYDRSDIKKLKQTWDRRAKKMTTDRTFKPKPSRDCTFCPFSQRKGGPCPH